MFYSDDPVRDFDRYDMAQAQKEAKCPECDKCGKHITDDFYYEIGGEILCEDCMHDLYAMSVEDYLDNHY